VIEVREQLSALVGSCNFCPLKTLTVYLLCSDDEYRPSQARVCPVCARKLLYMFGFLLKDGA